MLHSPRPVAAPDRLLLPSSSLVGLSQALVVPVSGDQRDYALDVCHQLQANGFFVDAEISHKVRHF